MDQDATWNMEVGLGPGDIVLDGDPAPPLFGLRLLWPNGRPSQQLHAELVLFT